MNENTFSANFLRLYTHTDIEREFDLLQYWGQEQKDSTLGELGFKDDVTYHIDADNYPEASLSAVTFDTDKTWQLIKSGPGKEGPIFTLKPNMAQFRIDFTSFVSEFIKP